MGTKDIGEDTISLVSMTVRENVDILFKLKSSHQNQMEK